MMGENIARKHVQLIWNNKLIYIVHLVGYFYSCVTMHGFTNIKFINLKLNIEIEYWSWILNLNIEDEYWSFKFLSSLKSSSILKDISLLIWVSNAENLTSNPKIRNSTARRTLGVSVRKSDILVLYRTAVLVGCEHHIKLKNVVKGNTELMYDMACGTYIYHCAAKGVMFLASC